MNHFNLKIKNGDWEELIKFWPSFKTAHTSDAVVSIIKDTEVFQESGVWITPRKEKINPVLIWHSGLWHRGDIRNVWFKDGKWEDGTFEDGVFCGGEFSDGIFRRSAFLEGWFCGGWFHHSEFSGGQWVGGVFGEDSFWSGGFICTFSKEKPE